MINGRKTNWIEGKCGFRQGCPLSPYLFILYSQVVSDALNSRKGNVGISISPKAPRVSHLLYADDILIFSEGKTKVIKELKSFINNYCLWSSQKVNNFKSMILFGKYTNHRIKKKISTLLKCMVVKELNYLGVKMTLRRVVSSDFSKLMEVVANRLNIWGQKFISLEGKVVLIKSAFLSLPMFLTSISLIPLSILKDFDKMCRCFLWKKKDGNAGIHYASSDSLCKTKEEGGRDLFSSVSRAGPLRAKLAWNFCMKPVTLLNQILRAKYGDDVQTTPMKRDCSPTWKIITMGAYYLRNIVRWDVSNGNSINWMFDNWILDKCIARWPTFVNCLESNEFKLNSFILEGKWNTDQFQLIFGEQLVKLITQNTIQVDRGYDLIELNSKFSRKSIAALAFQAFTEHNGRSAIWNWMKKLKLRPKVELFWWRLCNDSIPSNDFLFRRKLSSLSGCPRGCEEDENGGHIAGNCAKLHVVISILNS
ncbi:hypothetical protein KFK09_004066 [Dendrobium nobile]|uniref:Reverse transcriptase domain-containing protein n=1 Tax=Dendrobium nobile TaxID=94219 RepID=A0A8T3C1W4_DENNO|nr:hypothetical protein KFK09_004066 [Dendrobium nobile]